MLEYVIKMAEPFDVYDRFLLLHSSNGQSINQFVISEKEKSYSRAASARSEKNVLIVTGLFV